MTFAECLAQAEAQLREGSHPERTRRDAHYIFQSALGLDHAFVLTHPDLEVHSHSLKRFFELIARRVNGEPIQYIVGEQEFYGLPFRVTPDVLIPRPETEHLVEKTLEVAARLVGPESDTWLSSPTSKGTGFSPYIEQADSSGALAPEGNPSTTLRIVDVGTGSGAIAVALARHLPHARITAVDVSSAALMVAFKNAKQNRVPASMRFLQSNLLAAVAHEQFEIVVSNPPYIPMTDRASLAIEVRDHEPSLALYGGEDGLDVIRSLIPEAFAVLVPGGFLLFEIGYGQSESVTELLARSGFAGIEFVPDLQGILRVACAHKPT